MAFIGRLFVIFLAFLIASTAAGMVLVIGVVASDFSGIDSDTVERLSFFGSAFLAESYGGAAVLLPALVAVVLAEVARIRSVFYYGLAGAFVGLGSFYTFDLASELEDTTDIVPVGHGLALVIAAGVVGGLIYWLIAGRQAGRWRSEQVE
jgi:hypothetical protein